MIIPGQTMLVSETVYKAGEPAAPDSITAILYRSVAGVRSASGVTVTVSSTANTGEYTFTWTNGAGWARTDDLELKAIPVIDAVEYPMVVWRSHGHVDAVMRGTDGANTSKTGYSLTSDYDAAKTAAQPADMSGLATQASVDALPKYGDTLKRTKISASFSELQETITEVQ